MAGVRCMDQPRTSRRVPIQKSKALSMGCIEVWIVGPLPDSTIPDSYLVAVDPSAKSLTLVWPTEYPLFPKKLKSKDPTT